MKPHYVISAAQAELQACEAHLASMERELDERRARAVRDGLSVRCKAMVECGWAWGEMGKEGLRALESMGNGEPIIFIKGLVCFNYHLRYGVGLGHLPFPSQASPLQSQSHQNPQHTTLFHKPLPDPTQPSSDLSTANSLEPSQSASQINLPAPYRINDYTVPTGSSSGHEHVDNGRHQLSRRITEEDDEEEEDSSMEDIGPVQVVENARFASTSSFSGALGTKGNSGAGRKFSIRGGRTTKSDVGPSYQEPPSSPAADSGGRRERKGSFFGSIKGLFRGKKEGSEAGSEASYASIGGGRGITGKGKGKWKTRTETNVKNVSKRGGGGDSDDEDLAGVVSDPGVGVGYGGSVSVRGKKLSKKASVGKGVGAGDGVRKAEEWIGGQNSFTERENERWGTTPTPGREDDGGTVKARKRRKRKGGLAKENTNLDGEFSASGLHVVTLSRNSSVMSAASAPPATRSSTSNAFTTNSPSATNAKSQQPRRASSMRVAGTAGAGTRTKKRGSLPVNTPHGMGEGAVSLMSIVEGVTKANREGWAAESLKSSFPGSGAAGGLRESGKTNDWKAGVKVGSGGEGGSGSSGLQVPKAPPPIWRQQLRDDGELPLVTISAAPLEIPRAPVSVFGGGGIAGGSSVNISLGDDERTRKSSLPTPGPSSRTGLPASSSSTSTRPGMPTSRSSMDDAIGLRVTRPAKSPLRSALRTSRSPSPLPGPPSGPPSNSIPPSTSMTLTLLPGSNSIIPNGIAKDEDDISSVSSYETGHETFDVDDAGDGFNKQKDHPPPPPPPHDKEDSDISGASTSTPTYPTTAPSNSNFMNTQRRKSVRVSLQPTFSPTPPAFEDDDREYTWHSGDRWENDNDNNKVGKEEVAVRDIWEDSSDEDEEYARARRLLGRAARKSQGNGKSRTRH